MPASVMPPQLSRYDAAAVLTAMYPVGAERAGARARQHANAYL